MAFAFFLMSHTRTPQPQLQSWDFLSREYWREPAHGTIVWLWPLSDLLLSAQLSGAMGNSGRSPLARCQFFGRLVELLKNSKEIKGELL
jgi:hypothetical protein